MLTTTRCSVSPNILGTHFWNCVVVNCSLKDPNLTAIDPDTEEVVPLFNPRLNLWDEHFTWNGAKIALTSRTRSTHIPDIHVNLSLLLLEAAAVCYCAIEFNRDFIMYHRPTTGLILSFESQRK